MQKENYNERQEMSFSGKIKEELARQWSDARHCQIAELAAIISMCGKVAIDSREKYSIKVRTENVSVARKYFTLLRKTFNIDTENSVARNKSNGSIYYTVAGVRQSDSVGPVRMPFKPVAHPLRGHVVQLARRDAEVSADQFREYCATPVVKASYEVAVLPSADETVCDAGGSQGARRAHPAPERALLGIDDLTASHRNGRPHAIREVRVSPRDLRAGSLGRHDPALVPANMCPPFALRMSGSRRLRVDASMFLVVIDTSC